MFKPKFSHLCFYVFQDKFDAAFGNGFGPPEPDERYIYMYKHEHGIKCLKLKLQNEGFSYIYNVILLSEICLLNVCREKYNS